MISKFIGICAFLFPMVLLQTLESDVNAIEGTDQIVLNAIESVLIAEDTKNKNYFDDVEYTPEIGAQNIGRKFNIQYDLSAKEARSLSPYEYFIIGPVKNKKTIAYLHYDNSKKEEAIISWEDGVATKISYKEKSYLIGYNEAGLVRTLTESTQNKESDRKMHILLYTDDEKIESVSTSIVKINDTDRWLP